MNSLPCFKGAFTVQATVRPVTEACRRSSGYQTLTSHLVETGRRGRKEKQGRAKGKAGRRGKGRGSEGQEMSGYSELGKIPLKYLTKPI